MSLWRLPYEVISMILQSLDLEDVFHLALSSRRFKYLIRDDRSCKVFLQVSALLRPPSPSTLAIYLRKPMAFHLATSHVDVKASITSIS